MEPVHVCENGSSARSQCVSLTQPATPEHGAGRSDAVVSHLPACVPAELVLAPGSRVCTGLTSNFASKHSLQSYQPCAIPGTRRKARCQMKILVLKQPPVRVLPPTQHHSMQDAACMHAGDNQIRCPVRTADARQSSSQGPAQQYSSMTACVPLNPLVRRDWSFIMQ